MIKCQQCPIAMLSSAAPLASASTSYAATQHIRPRERYLWDLEEDYEQVLADAYSPSKLHPAVKETVRQRQERLEFVRRQEFARRLALKGLRTPAASEYVVKRLPPPRRANAGQRAVAAIKIQRTFRAYLQKLRLEESIASIADSLASLRARSNSSHRNSHSHSHSHSSSHRRSLYPSELQQRLASLLTTLQRLLPSLHCSAMAPAYRLLDELRGEMQRVELEMQMQIQMQSQRQRKEQAHSDAWIRDLKNAVRRGELGPAERWIGELAKANLSLNSTSSNSSSSSSNSQSRASSRSRSSSPRPRTPTSPQSSLSPSSVSAPSPRRSPAPPSPKRSTSRRPSLDSIDEEE